MSLTRQKQSDEELRIIIAERLGQILLGMDETRDNASLIQSAEAAIGMAIDILAPTDNDLRNLGDLYLNMGIILKSLKNYEAVIKNVEIALSTYHRVKDKSDKYYFDLLCAKEVLGTTHAIQGPEGKLAALIAFSEAIDAFTKIKKPDDEHYRKIASVYEWIAYLETNSTEKKIDCYVSAINFYEQIKFKNDVDYKSMVKSCKMLGVSYTKLTPNKYPQAIAVEMKGIEVAKLIMVKSDQVLRNLSALYYHLYLDLTASGESANHDCLQLLKNSLSAFQAITHKDDNDYGDAAGVCYELAALSYETNKFFPIMPYIQQIYMLLAKINNITRTHIHCLHITAILTVNTGTPTDPAYVLATLINGLTQNHVNYENQFIAFVRYIVERANWPEVIAVNEILVSVITILLNAADNDALAENKLRNILLKGSDTRKLYEFMRSELMTHPALQLSQQIEHSMPLMTAIAKRLQGLELEVQSLKEFITKRERESDVALPDQRAKKRQDNATSQTLGLFAAAPTLGDQEDIELDLACSLI